eukprot:3777315-Rhodomonas_salina.1
MQPCKASSGLGLLYDNDHHHHHHIIISSSHVWRDQDQSEVLAHDGDGRRVWVWVQGAGGAVEGA